MNEHLDCELCGGSIEAGEAWMADGSGGLAAHAGCVYRDEHDPATATEWQPQEQTAG